MYLSVCPLSINLIFLLRSKQDKLLCFLPPRQWALAEGEGVLSTSYSLLSVKIAIFSVPFLYLRRRRKCWLQYPYVHHLSILSFAAHTQASHEWQYATSVVENEALPVPLSDPSFSQGILSKVLFISTLFLLGKKKITLPLPIHSVMLVILKWRLCPIYNWRHRCSLHNI